jgi:hypothetical protein
MTCRPVVGSRVSASSSCPCNARMPLQRMRPNPLVELTRCGMAPDPRAAFGRSAPHGPGATLPVPAHHERQASEVSPMCARCSSKASNPLSLCKRRYPLTMQRVASSSSRVPRTVTSSCRNFKWFSAACTNQAAVVFTTLLRLTPRRPKRCISRATVHRATSRPRSSSAPTPCRHHGPAGWHSTPA